MTREQNLEAVFVLLRAALGISPGKQHLEFLRNSCPEQLVKVTTAHGIANLLGSTARDEQTCAVLDPEFVLFLDVMRQRNAERNAVLRTQSMEAAEQLNRAGIPCVALKGGAELFDPVYPNPADRFLSDIDLLVPSDRINDAIQALGAIDYWADGPWTDIHAPAMWHDKWPTAIELHTGVCEPPGTKFVPADDVFNRAYAPGNAPVKVPAIIDRIAHLVLHAQIHSARFYSNRVLLRDVADLHWLNTKEPISGELRSRFAAADLLPLFDGFVSVGEQVLGRRLTHYKSSAGAQDWAEQTLTLLAHPNVHRRAHVLWMILHYPRRFFGDKAVRQQYLRDMSRPKTLRDFFRRHLDALRGYQ